MEQNSANSKELTTDTTNSPFPNMVWIPGGTYVMGSDNHYPEEAPAHKVSVNGFWMDKFTVTNRDFKKFIDDTGYVTIAEKPLNPSDYPGATLESLVPGSLIFYKPPHRVDLRNIGNWWRYIPGANWKNPEGPKSSIEKKWDHPVVHVAWKDVETYAKWAGKELPTEAEWEFAARGGLEENIYEWGDEMIPKGKMMANFWIGEFPWQNIRPHGYEGTCPVGSFPANGFGLHDMTGNVWEWTSDWYESKHQHDKKKTCCIPVNPRGGNLEKSYDPHQPQFRIPRKVLKGGSHLCAQNYCYRYRPAARHAQMIDSSSCHIGFRCIVRVNK
jgi:formylglycine-generating enzyme required for sulfatase activity